MFISELPLPRSDAFYMKPRLDAFEKFSQSRVDAINITARSDVFDNFIYSHPDAFENVF